MPSRRATLIRNLACAALNSADTSRDYHHYKKDEDLDLEDLWGDYWDASYRLFFFSAFFTIPEEARRSELVRAVAQSAGVRFLEALADEDRCWDVVEALPAVERSQPERFTRRLRFFNGVETIAVPWPGATSEILERVKQAGF
jgi:hypothetical protein